MEILELPVFLKNEPESSIQGLFAWSWLLDAVDLEESLKTFIKQSDLKLNVIFFPNHVQITVSSVLVQIELNNLFFYNGKGRAEVSLHWVNRLMLKISEDQEYKNFMVKLNLWSEF